MKIGKLILITIIISSLFSFSTNTVGAIDESEIIIDLQNDVYILDYFEEGETRYITEHKDIDVKNIDIREIRYDRKDKIVTFRLRVEGEIEDRGDLFDLYDPYPSEEIYIVDNVNYQITLQTTNNDTLNSYFITYSNKTCKIVTPNIEMNLSEDDYYIENKDTLVVTFELESEGEIYENMNVTAIFLKFNLFDYDTIPDDADYSDLFTFLTDVVPNPPVEIFANVVSLGLVGKAIDFNGSALLGQPPYTYLWDFGDGSTSNKKNPTHAYNKPGEYEYSLTVTDNSGDSARFSDKIKISGSDGDGESAPIVIFIGVIIIIVVIGIIAVIYIIRR